MLVYQLLNWKLSSTRLLGRLQKHWKDNVKAAVENTGSTMMKAECTKLFLDRGRWWDFTDRPTSNTVQHARASYTAWGDMKEDIPHFLWFTAASETVCRATSNHQQHSLVSGIASNLTFPVHFLLAVLSCNSVVHHDRGLALL